MTFFSLIQRLAGERAVGGVSRPFPEVRMFVFASGEASVSVWWHRSSRKTRRRGHLKGHGGLWEGSGGPPKHVFTRFRSHAQLCMKIDDERCLEESLQVSLEVVRQAKSSFARVVHDFL